MEAGEHLHVLVDDRVARFVAHAAEVRSPGDGVHHKRVDCVDPAIDARDWESLIGDQRLEAHLVIEREHQLHIAAVAAHAELYRPAVTIRFHEPHRPPTRLAADRRHRRTHLGGNPLHDRLGLRLRSGRAFNGHSIPLVSRVTLRLT
jgi:hypothetical protein